PSDRMIKSVRGTLGGADPVPAARQSYAPAQLRPLYAYVKPSDVYRCPVDKGTMSHTCSPVPTSLLPSNFAVIGCSYQYNAGNLVYPDVDGHPGGFRQIPEDAGYGMAQKSESWVPQPSMYILGYEPPARVYGCGIAWWHQWHYLRGSPF